MLNLNALIEFIVKKKYTNIKLSPLYNFCLVLLMILYTIIISEKYVFNINTT